MTERPSGERPSALLTPPKTVNQAELAGYISPTGQKVSFLVPVYRSDRSFFQQDTVGGDKIERFAPLSDSISDRLIESQTHHGVSGGREHNVPFTLRVGDQAIFAFRFPDHSIVTGTRRQIVESLHKRRRDLSSHPFVALAVAKFLGDIEFGRRQVFKSAHHLERKNKSLGQAWLETELRSLEPDLEETHRRTFSPRTKDDQIFHDIKGRLDAGWDVHVRLKLERSSAGISPKLKNLLTSFQLGKRRIGTETRFLRVTTGSFRNIKQVAHLVRVIDMIELPAADRLERSPLAASPDSAREQHETDH
jgi:hypothetical protein